MFDSLVTMFGAPVAAVLTAAIKGALLIAGAAVVARLLRHRSAAARHAVWATAMLGHLVLLVATPLLPAVEVPVVPSVSWNDASAPTTAPVSTDNAPAAAPTRNASPATGTANTPAESQATPPVTTPMPSALTILVALWLAGAMVVFTRYLLGTAYVARLARRSARVDDGGWLSLAQRMAGRMGIDRPLILMRGAELQVPVTWGILYPVVLLPEGADGWTDEQKQFVLAHELAHVKRLDAVTQLLTQITIAVFWFSPLVWYAAHRIRVEREHACDDHVLLNGTRPSFYADELLAMVRNMSDRRFEVAPAFAALAMARRSEFEGRMLAILDAGATRAPTSRGARAAMLAALLFLITPLAALRPVSATTTDAAPSATVTASPAPELSSTVVPIPAAMTAKDSTPRTLVAGANPPAIGTRYVCRRSDLDARGNQTSIHGHTDDNPASSYTEVVMRSRGHCAYALMLGSVSLALDLRDVTAVAPGGRATFVEMTPQLSRALTITRAGNGALVREYTENGTRVDPSRSSGWLGELLRALVLKGGYGVTQRVQQLRARGGVTAVLDEAAQAPSSGVKRAYLTALIQSAPRLTRAESDLVVSFAGAHIDSAGDLRAVMVAALQHANPSARAVEEAVQGIASSGDQRAVLTRSLEASNAEMVRAAVRAAIGISSDGDKAAVLRQAAPRALTGDAVRAEFYAAAASIHSDGDKRGVLVAAARHTPKTAAAVRQLLTAATTIESDGDKSAVLIAAVDAGLVVDAATRDAFVEAAGTIESDGDRGRVLNALLR